MGFVRKKKTSLSDIALAGAPKLSSTVKKEESLAGIADGFKRDFCNWLETDYVRNTDYRSPGRHASSLWKTCGRRTILEALLGLERLPEVNAAGSFMTTDEGHIHHELWQDSYLAGWGKLRGRWVCSRCEKIYGTDDAPVVRPKGCSGPTKLCAERPDFKYKETRINIKDRDIVGSVDAIIDYREQEYVGEIKTKSVSQFKLLHYPEYGHIVQGTAYMAGRGIDKAIFIYVQKGKLATWTRPGGVWTCTGTTMKIFVVPFDQKLWDKITMLIDEDNDALDRVERDGLYEPEARLEDHEGVVEGYTRACGSIKSEIAKQCPVREQCFAIEPMEV
jgi:hypothetical protein